MFTTDLTDLTVTEGGAVNLHPQATDADGDTLTYAASGLPDGVTIDPRHRRHQRHRRSGHGRDVRHLGDRLRRRPRRHRHAPHDGAPDRPRHADRTRSRASDDQQVELSWNANSEPDLAGYNLYRSTSLPVSTSGTALNGATLLTTTNYLDTGVTNDTTYYYVLTAVDSEGHASPATPAIAATPGESVGTALTLTASSQYVTFGAAPALGAPNFTVELWFRRTGAGVGVTTGGDGIASAIPLVTKGRSESGVDMNYFLGIDATSGRLVADFEDTADATNHPVTGTTLITNDVWHHAAAAYDTATDTWRLYLDGVLDRTLALGGDFTPAAPSPSHSAIGSALTSTGVAAGFFQGSVDEVRIWNVARTTAQIAGDREPRAPSRATGCRPLRPERGRRLDRRLERRRRARRHARRRAALGVRVRRSRRTSCRRQPRPA